MTAASPAPTLAPSHVPPAAPRPPAPSRSGIIDRALIAKYDGAGPRYTSYPTAPNFQPLGSDAYRHLLETSARGQRQLSLYIHLPFCRTLCFYCGCNVTISRSVARARAYLRHVKWEMAAAAAHLRSSEPGGDSRQVVQIHLGGGTPNFFPPEDLLGFLTTFRHTFDLHPDCEIGIEVDPRTMTDEHLDALAEGGVNRLSAGLQDLDPQVQKAIHRIQSADMTQSVVDGSHQRGIESVNLDLIYGLPHQTPESFARTLDAAIAMAPERFAVFNFAYLPEMLPHQQVIDASALPSAQDKLTLLETAYEKLDEAGYVMIGMDHFARPEDPLSQALENGSLTRNFQGYSTQGETDLVAFGASAIGFVGGGYVQNLKTVKEYQTAIETRGFATCRGRVLSDEDLLRRDVILRLMCSLHLDIPDVEQRFDINFSKHFASELKALTPLAEDGLVEVRPQAIRVTPAGRLLVRNVAMVFDEYLDHGQKTTFSRTV